MSDAPKFTRGPWQAKVQPGQIVGKHTFTHEVVTPSECIATLLRASDAYLIAAAPRLYTACEALAKCLRDPDKYGGVTTDEALLDADAALAAARGEVQP